MSQLDLALRYAIEQRSGDLLRRGMTAAGKAGETSLKLSQVKGLVQVVEENQGVEHVANWLRYQSARESAWRDRDLLATILKDFEELKEDAQGLSESELPIVWLAMVRRYVVYFHRKFAVLRKDEQDE